MSHGNKHIFISYVTEDLHRVKKLARHLSKSGFQVWFDENSNHEYGLNKGGTWEIEIEDAIDESFAFLICFSRSTAARDRLGILPELDRAISHQRQILHRFIFTILFNDVRLPKVKINSTTNIQDLQHTLFYKSHELQRSEYRKLVASLRSVCPSNDNNGADDELSEPYAVPSESAWGVILDDICDFGSTITATFSSPKGRKRWFYTFVSFVLCYLLSMVIGSFFTDYITDRVAPEAVRYVPYMIFIGVLVPVWSRPIFMPSSPP